ncbi:MAG TPA: hypothetical protein EYH05_04050 [Anaerolineae bacterium]|nr:hypothetical protein [Anaerolineae bacterium]
MTDPIDGFASYQRANVACEILASPAPDGNNIVSGPTVFLSNRTTTPPWPLQNPTQVDGHLSYRDILQCFIFAADDTDWATLQTVDEGMTLRLADSGAEFIIRRVDKWERSWADFQQRHNYLHLTVEQVKVTA